MRLLDSETHTQHTVNECRTYKADSSSTKSCLKYTESQKSEPT